MFIFPILIQGQSLISEELFYAGEKGDVNRCLELIQNGADVNWKAGKILVSIHMYGITDYLTVACKFCLSCVCY